MKYKKCLLSFVCLSAVLSLATPAFAAEEIAESKPVPRFFACIMDVSASMRRNDPDRFAEQGAQLAIALLNQNAYFSTVAFSSGARVQCRASLVGNSRNRLRLQKRITGIARIGNTNYLAALKVTRQHLVKTLGEGVTGAVVFLTDGKNTAGGTAKDIKQEIGLYKNLGIPIYPISLGKEVDTTILQLMAARTGGVYFNVSEPKALIGAFVDIVSYTEGFLVKHGPFDSATVKPGTKRLIYLAAKEEKSAAIDSITMNGGEPLWDGKFNYPERTNSKNTIRLISYTNPKPGLWSAKTVGKTSGLVTLIEPPFRLDFVAARPKLQYIDGQEIVCTLKATADTAEALDGLGNHSKFNVEISSTSAGATIADTELKRVESLLPPQASAPKEAPKVDGANNEIAEREDEKEKGPAPAPVYFETRTVAKLFDPENNDSQTIRVDCLLAWADNEQWKQEKVVSYEIIPANNLFETENTELDFGTMWVTDEPITREIKLSTICESGLFTATSDTPGITSPERGVMCGGEKQQPLLITLDPSKTTSPVSKPEEATEETTENVADKAELDTGFGGELAISLDYGHLEGKHAVTNIPFKAEILRLEGGDVEISGVQPGGSLEHALPYKLTPARKLDLKLSTLKRITLGPDVIPEVEGFDAPAGISEFTLAVKMQEDGSVLAGDIPKNLRPGMYEGEIELSIPGTELASKTFSVRVGLGELKPSIEIISMEDETVKLEQIESSTEISGWFDTVVRVKPINASDTNLVVEFSDLISTEGDIIPQMFCSGTGSAEEGWNGRTLSDKETYDLALKLYPLEDLPNGTYEGTVKFVIMKNDEAKAEVTLPIKLTLNYPAGASAKVEPEVAE